MGKANATEALSRSVAIVGIPVTYVALGCVGYSLSLAAVIVAGGSNSATGAQVIPMNIPYYATPADLVPIPVIGTGKHIHPSAVGDYTLYVVIGARAGSQIKVCSSGGIRARSYIGSFASW